MTDQGANAPVTEIETVDERLRAVERALAAGDESDRTIVDPDGELTERIDDLATDIAELDAAVQAVRGYVGHVRAVDETVEREADAALTAVETLRDRVSRLEDGAWEFGVDRPTDEPSAATDERLDAAGETLDVADEPSNVADETPADTEATIAGSDETFVPKDSRDTISDASEDAVSGSKPSHGDDHVTDEHASSGGNRFYACRPNRGRRRTEPGGVHSPLREAGAGVEYDRTDAREPPRRYDAHRGGCPRCRPRPDETASRRHNCCESMREPTPDRPSAPKTGQAGSRGNDPTTNSAADVHAEAGSNPASDVDPATEAGPTAATDPVADVDEGSLVERLRERL